MISLTAKAATRIKELFENQGLPETACVRFAVKGGGCSGFIYSAEVAPPRKFDMPSKHDSKFISNGVRILVDKKSLLFLDGSQVDCKDTRFGHSFIYTNPNSTGSCGCGESFSV